MGRIVYRPHRPQGEWSIRVSLTLLVASIAVAVFYAFMEAYLEAFILFLVGLGFGLYSLLVIAQRKTWLLVAEGLKLVEASYVGGELRVRIAALSGASIRFSLILSSGCAYHVSISDLAIRHQLPYMGVYANTARKALASGVIESGEEAVITVKLEADIVEPRQICFRSRRGYVSFFQGTVAGLDLVVEKKGRKAGIQVAFPLGGGMDRAGEGESNGGEIVYFEGPRGLRVEQHVKSSNGCHDYIVSTSLGGDPLLNIVVSGKKICSAGRRGEIRCGGLVAGSERSFNHHGG